MDLNNYKNKEIGWDYRTNEYMNREKDKQQRLDEINKKLKRDLRNLGIISIIAIIYFTTWYLINGIK